MAVRLMYAGAVVSALSLIVGLATIGSLRSSLHKSDPTLTASQLHSLQSVVVVGSVVIGVISIGLWVWMALMNKAGKSWARIVSTVLFGLDTLFLLLGVARAGAAAGTLVSILTWLIGLGAVIFLWRKDSSAYFAPKAAQ
jgi:type III secretory pathway component EscU